ncbi:MAG: T9SS type A sorting domain-containing protein [Bacteroidetes bacterium]|nr:T9SS type A sorting domain-containing protein [Bacteroidota bacterium]
MKMIAAVLLCVCSLMGLAQKNDYIWYGGYGSDMVIDSVQFGYRFGQSKLDFRSGPMQVSYDSLGMNFTFTSVTYSDNEGNLLFYTNGISVRNGLDHKVLNGDSMHLGWLTLNWDLLANLYGQNVQQGIIVLPSITNPDQYFLVYGFIDSFPGTGGDQYIPSIKMSILDMAANMGMGELIVKDSIIAQGTFGNEVTAVRHGNGQDWWLMFQNRTTSCFTPVLYNTSGFNVMPITGCNISSIPRNEMSAACFSPIGDKYANFHFNTGIRLLDFDRCRGILYNWLYIPSSFGTDSAWYTSSLAFSPNGRFLYMTSAKVLIQYDTWAIDVISSADTIAWYDGYRAPNGAYLNAMQLGPDGKIYIACGNAEYVYHVINSPDEKGANCDFVQHGIRLPSLVNGVPNYPNYRLGALPGSACDTLTSIKDIAEKEKILKVFPNPANDVAAIDYGYTDWSKGEVVMEIANSLGQTVHSQSLPMYSGFQKLQVGNYPSGSYTVYIKRKGVVVATGRLVKQ